MRKEKTDALRSKLDEIEKNKAAWQSGFSSNQSPMMMAMASIGGSQGANSEEEETMRRKQFMKSTKVIQTKMDNLQNSPPHLHTSPLALLLPSMLCKVPLVCTGITDSELVPVHQPGRQRGKGEQAR